MGNLILQYQLSYEKNILMKPILLTLISYLFISGLSAQIQGPNNGSQFSTIAIAGSSQTWTNMSNTAGSNDSYATFGDLPNTAGAYTDYLIVSGFGFVVPYGGVLSGITVEIERSDANGLTADYSVRIVKNAMIGASERASGIAYPATDAYQSYGGLNDLWGETWSHKEISSASFGVAISAQRTATGGITAGTIDHVRITIHYQLMFTLPVNLTSFTAVKSSANSVKVKWTTTDESSIDHYQVERSVNGRDFTAMGLVMSNNNSSLTNYSFNDNNAVKGGSWYRLKIVGQSGSPKYSPVVAIQIDETGKNKLFPTLVSAGQTIGISNAGNEPLKLQFFNSGGHMVANVTTMSGQVPAQSLAAVKGMVYYKIADSKGNITGSGKLILQ
jgi:hypothetical protein